MTAIASQISIQLYLGIEINFLTGENKTKKVY